MSNIVLSVENLYKQYRLGMVGTGTMRDDLARFWAKLRGKEDPSLKIGEVNDRQTIQGEYVWALQDINFEVKQGEVLGIIGKNGAGKSTLLKILSKVTSPTKGQIKTKGRIASLLEVGTGFHPELTGRENVFLNGAILGMTKNDIKSKFDEIIEFSGIGKYIDTPVKRYSSGMYVRLAFAVAAHLEPEILIIDEVLAVGDAEFQKKCLGKMKDVSGEGRTVLFVSHNMTAVRSLCSQSLFLQYGEVKSIGDTESILNNYLQIQADSVLIKEWDIIQNSFGNDIVKIKKAQIVLEEKQEKILVSTSFNFNIEFWYLEDYGNLNISLHIYTGDDSLLFVTASKKFVTDKSICKFSCYFPANFFNDNVYSLSVMVVHESAPIYVFENVISFEVFEEKRESAWLGKWPGLLRPVFKWNFSNEKII